MDRIKKEISKLYFNKLLEKLDHSKISDFIDKHLDENERYISLQEYLSLFAEKEERIVPAEGDYLGKHHIDLKSKILPLPLKLNKDISRSNIGSTYISSSKIINLMEQSTFQNGIDKSRSISATFSFVKTENNHILLLKCLMYEKKIRYFALSLDSFFNKDNVKENPFDKAAFLIGFLSDLLTSLPDDDKMAEAYTIADLLYFNAINNFIEYNLGNYDDLYYIAESLKINNSNYGDISVKKTSRKKDLIIRLGNHEIPVKLFEAKIDIIKKGKALRAKSAIYPKDDVDNIIIKARENNTSGKFHYIFVPNIKESIKMAEEREGIKIAAANKRFYINALFYKADNGDLILKRNSICNGVEIACIPLHELKFT